MTEKLQERTVDMILAKAQAHFYVSAQKRVGNTVSQENVYRLEMVFAALDDALSAGSVCVTENRFNTVCDVCGQKIDFKETLEELLAANLVTLSSFPKPTQTCPLIVDKVGQWRIYDERNFQAEGRLATRVMRLAKGAESEPAVADPLKESQRAQRLAIKNRLTVVSGGPGTGKTTAVMFILRALLEKNNALKIRLVAPTGKAAGRMQESVRSQAGRLDPGPIKDVLSGLNAQTIHRFLLAPMPDGTRPSKETPADCDVLVVDESSMIAVGLAVQLLEAIDVERTRVILLGDRHQLAAVGPGSVFGDLSDINGTLSNNISHLTYSHRFAAEKSIAKLSGAINAGNVKEVVGELEAANAKVDVSEDNKINWHLTARVGKNGLSSSLMQWLDTMVEAVMAKLPNPDEHLDEERRKDFASQACSVMQSYGILCAQRRGPMSLKTVNDYVDALFVKRGYRGSKDWRQIIVRQNDDVLGVHNGDVGVIVQACEGRPDEVYFPGEDKDSGRFVKLGLLPHYELAFAITIHQSQGSEYEHVAVVLPNAAESELATRELLYTAVTRVKDVREPNTAKRYGTLDLFASKAVLEKAVKTPVRREGALPERLEALVNA